MTFSSLSRMAFSLCALAVLPALLAACAADSDTAQDNAMQAPPVLPEAPIEIPPRLNNPQGEIWRPGYWVLSHGMFSWVPGKIIARPSPTAVWDPARWVPHNYGWSFQEGHWE